MGFESMPTLEAPESDNLTALLHSENPAISQAAQEVVDAIEGGEENLKYLNDQEKAEVETYIKKYIELSKIATPVAGMADRAAASRLATVNNQKEKRIIQAEVKRIGNAAFDREN